MLSHITLGTDDLPRAMAFYDPVLATLGLSLRFREEHWAGWQATDAERPLFIVTTPLDGSASAGNGTMIAFEAMDRAAVTRCHAVALAHGGTDAGAPGPRPQYHADYFGAYFRDPDGNKLAVACHAPSSPSGR